MKWIDFVINVQKWARERGIYEHSTPDAQLLKALSEVGELADAYAKQDTDGVIDGIGDVLVCLVNHQTMVGGDTDAFQESIASWGGGPAQNIGHMALSIGVYIGRDADCSHGLLPYMRTGLAFFADSMRIDFESCLQAAWDAIKDRKGHMVAGGVFVKEVGE